MNIRKSILQFRPASCKNCYKCIRNCPVKAIRVKDHQAAIMEDQCVLCEKCTLVCPQDAKVELNQIPEIQRRILHGERVIASIHPTYLAQYGNISFNDLKQALKQLGFTDAFDAAEGGAAVRRAYEELLEKRKDDSIIISSQCAVVTLLVERHYPELIPYLAPVPSMMQVHREMLKSSHPRAVVVSVSPCISIMAENEDEADYVITFSELDLWMHQNNIAVSCTTGGQTADIRLSRLLALEGGLSQSLRHHPGRAYIAVGGMVNSMGILQELREGTNSSCFLDLSACINGCVGGPSFRKQPTRLLDAILAVRSAALPENGIADFTLDYPPLDLPEWMPERRFTQASPSHAGAAREEEIRAILEQMGKNTPKDELNCGACGYNTCREKAMAILEGKAEISMCVPFMRARQESYSNKIVNAMPGLLITVDYQMNIVHMNKAALDLFDITRKKQLLGKPLAQIMDDYALVNMVSFEKRIAQDQIVLPDGQTWLDRVLTNDRENRLILCIMKDITREMDEKKRRTAAQAEAAEIADRLMEEQLRLVHKIAGLLGETAADTKVAVERLKDTIYQEELP